MKRFVALEAPDRHAAVVRMPVLFNPQPGDQAPGHRAVCGCHAAQPGAAGDRLDRYCQLNEIQTAQPINGFIPLQLGHNLGARHHLPAIHRMPLSETRDSESLESNADPV